jgi:hypothetical protein
MWTADLKIMTFYYVKCDVSVLRSHAENTQRLELYSLRKPLRKFLPPERPCADMTI